MWNNKSVQDMYSIWVKLTFKHGWSAQHPKGWTGLLTRSQTAVFSADGKNSHETLKDTIHTLHHQQQWLRNSNTRQIPGTGLTYNWRGSRVMKENCCFRFVSLFIINFEVIEDIFPQTLALQANVASPLGQRWNAGYKFATNAVYLLLSRHHLNDACPELVSQRHSALNSWAVWVSTRRDRKLKRNSKIAIHC